ncbi:helix-turn-helix domain-containing protein [Ciceribacter sp. RN22]|uniref:helix-turn-helix domain-containing protein n=1 Tax=Ciceribacter sp. RN22 TaxID=2954932 RepID=UPI0020923B54|nr:hypothetical protein [Ciceribacter sp. RN22]
MMTRRPPRSPEAGASAGKLAGESGTALLQRTVFGKRASAPDRERSARLVHLSVLAGEVSLLLGGEEVADGGLVSMPSESDPSLTIGTDAGRSLKVVVDAETGFYVLHEDGGAAGCTIITASEERLLDHIVSQLASGSDDLAPRTLDAAVDLLVGRSLEEVEWRLILRALRRFGGDMRSVAFALGISTEELKSKLRMQLLTRRRVISSAGERQ